MEGTSGAPPASTRVLTAPNVISFARIASIPLLWIWIVHEATTTLGIIAFSFVVATDWVDGTIARRTGQVSELGKLLDPLADRLVVVTGVVALVVRGAFPLPAAIAIVARDVVIVVLGGALLAGKRVRLDVRWIGKLATFSLMCAIAWISWGTLDLPLAATALVAGWVSFATGIVESYVAAAIYLRDAVRAVRALGA
jgi:CDP-diacylglycerol--glycerol-3-phosphate 3-phosphatidyltransferase